MIINPLDLSLRFVEQHPTDAVGILESLPAEKTCDYILNASENCGTQLIGLMSANYAAVCVSLLPASKTVPLFKELEIQTTVEIFRYLNTRDKNRLINQLPLNKRLAVQALNKYNQNSVGAWMRTDFIAVTEDTTIEEIIEIIQQSHDPYQDYVYIVNSKRQFVYAVRTATLLKTGLHARISTVKTLSTECLMARAMIQDVTEHPGWQHHRVLPVTEYDNRLAGILSYSDLNIAMEQSHLAFSNRAADVSGEAINLFWLVFNNFLHLFIDASAAILKKR